MKFSAILVIMFFAIAISFVGCGSEKSEKPASVFELAKVFEYKIHVERIEGQKPYIVVDKLLAVEIGGRGDTLTETSFTNITVIDADNHPGLQYRQFADGSRTDAVLYIPYGNIEHLDVLERTSTL